jgi:YggT family protein
MSPLLYLFNMIVELIVFVVIASAIASWLVAFGVVNMRNHFVRTLVETLYRLTEPMLRPIRRIMPNLGGVDISPIALLVILYFVRYAVNYYLGIY